MDDPNSAAAANAVAAGRNFWGNVQQMRENRFTKTRLGIEQQAADVGTAAQKLKSVEYSDITKPAADVALAGQKTALGVANKGVYGQSHNPLTAAAPDVTQQNLSDLTTQAKPITDPAVAATQGYPVGTVQFPTPQSKEDRATFGIPDTHDQPTWAMPPDQFQTAAQTVAARQAQTDLSQPYDQMSPRAQQAILKSYKDNAPAGVTMSDGDAAKAFRAQQSQTQPQVTPESKGLMSVGGTANPNIPGSFQEQYMANMGQGGEGDNQPFRLIGGEWKPNPDYRSPKDDNLSLQKVISGNPELKSAQEKATHVSNVMSYANEPHPTVSSDKSLIMSYLKTIDPTVRVSEGTVTTVMDGMGIPDEIMNAAQKFKSGSVFTPEHRQWFAKAAAQNLENARQAAAQSIQSQVSIEGATGNRVARNFKLPPNVLPPGQKQGPAHGEGEAVSSGSSGSEVGTSPKVYATPAQADAAGHPAGTVLKVVNPTTGQPQSYRTGGVAR